MRLCIFSSGNIAESIKTKMQLSNHKSKVAREYFDFVYYSIKLVQICQFVGVKIYFEINF